MVSHLYRRTGDPRCGAGLPSRASWACARSRSSAAVRSYPASSPYPMVKNFAMTGSFHGGWSPGRTGR
ncbi:hypothetical protein ACFQZ4_05755 [Catellatospora coxensis]